MSAVRMTRMLCGINGRKIAMLVLMLVFAFPVQLLAETVGGEMMAEAEDAGYDDRVEEEMPCAGNEEDDAAAASVLVEDVSKTDDFDITIPKTGSQDYVMPQSSTSLAGDSPASAKPIRSDQTVEDVCSTYTTSCWYTFTTSSDGYVSITFESDWVDKTYNGWDIKLYAQSDLQNCIFYDFFSGGGVVPRDYGRYGLPQGKYYLEVSPSGTAGTRFSFTLSCTASSVWERERNGSANIANDILLGVKYFGNLDAREGSSLSFSDYDCYRFNLKSSARVRLAFGSERDYDSSRATFETNSGEFVCTLQSANQVGTDDELMRKRCYGASTKDVGETLQLSAGTYYILIRGGGYTSTSTYHLSVSVVKPKAPNPMKLKAVKRTVRVSKVKRRSVKVSRPLKVKGAQGTVTYKKMSGSKCLSVNKKSGKVTVKKGTKRGVYKVRIKVTAAGNGSYKKGTKTVSCKVVVK